jgi:predicted small metal-binding protein
VGESTATLRCACGWEVTASVDEVVTATQGHAERVHNMVATRDEVLARLTAENARAADPSER